MVLAVARSRVQGLGASTHIAGAANCVMHILAFGTHETGGGAGGLGLVGVSSRSFNWLLTDFVATGRDLEMADGIVVLVFQIEREVEEGIPRSETRGAKEWRKLNEAYSSFMRQKVGADEESTPHASGGGSLPGSAPRSST